MVVKRKPQNKKYRPTPHGGLLNNITEDLSCAIAQARRAEMRLAEALDLLPPHTIGCSASDGEIWTATLEIDQARIELHRAAQYAACAIETWLSCIIPPSPKKTPEQPADISGSPDDFTLPP